MRETRACLEVAVAFGYLGSLDGELGRRMDHGTGTLVRLVDGPAFKAPLSDLRRAVARDNTPVRPPA